MRDPIERQDAIDALDKQIEYCDKALADFDISMKDEYAVKVEKASLVAFREQLEYLPSAQPEQSEMIKDIRKWINSGNRGNADYFIVDKIEEIINKYERRYNQQTGGD